MSEHQQEKREEVTEERKVTTQESEQSQQPQVGRRPDFIENDEDRDDNDQEQDSDQEQARVAKGDPFAQPQGNDGGADSGDGAADDNSATT
jgi:hypothetical protein